MIQTRGISMIQAEKEVLGTTHAEAGAYLMALWGFPDGVINACAFHHTPSALVTKGFNTVTAVHVANVFDGETSNRELKVPDALDQEYIAREGFASRLDAWRSATAPVQHG